MKKVIIDVDTGIDDALALILAIKSNKLDLIGVTTVAGNVPVEKSTENTLKVLKILGREDINVYQGCNKPLSRDIEFHGYIHGSDGIGGQLAFMTTGDKGNISASEYIIKSINDNPEEITIIMLGPLTNLALALKNEPSIGKKIKEIYIMGGAVRAVGNITPVAEFNFYKDPESAYKVLHSGIAIKLVGLDVTNNAIIREEDLKNIEDDSPYKEFIINILKFYIDKSSGDKSDRIGIMHDPLVVASVIDPGLLEFEKTFVDIEYSSRISDGQSIAYFGRKGYLDNVQLAVSFDQNRFRRLFLDLLSN